MLRMLLPPLRPSRGCGTSRLGRPHCAGARPGSASCLGTRGAGPFGTCSLPRARRWGRAGALLRELESCPEPAPGVAVGAARAHKRRGARGAAGGSKAARLSRSPQSWGPDPHSHAPGSGLSASPPTLRRAGKAKSTGHGGDGRRSAAARQERVRALADTRDVLRVGGRSARPGRAPHPLPPGHAGPARGLQPRGGEARQRAPHPAAGDCAPSHTHTRPAADKGVLCFL